MKKIIGIAMLLSLGVYSASSRADEVAWERVYFPAYDGYVISYERPGDWQVSGKNVLEKKPYTYTDGARFELSSNRFVSSVIDMKARNEKIGYTPPGTYDGEMDFSVKQYVLPKPIAIAEWVKKEKSTWPDFAMIVYSESFADFKGRQSFQYELSGLTTWKNKEEVPATDPTRKKIVVPFFDDVLIEVSFGVRYFYEQFNALKPVAERMLASLEVIPVEELGEKNISTMCKTEEVVISDGGHGYSAGFSFTLPTGWTREATEVKSATSKDPRGRLAVKISRQGAENKDAALLLIVEALSPTNNTFDEMGKRVIETLVQDIDPASGKKIEMPHRFICTGHVYNLIYKAGGKITYYRTFQGKDNNGTPVTAQICSGGNRQAAFHGVYINSTADFDKTLPTIEKIFTSVNAIEDMVR